MTGQPPSREPLGHFTTMQVRDRAVQGLDLHLARLREANRELFDTTLDEPALRSRIGARLAEGDAGKASTLRIVIRPGECSRPAESCRSGDSRDQRSVAAMAAPAGPARVTVEVEIGPPRWPAVRPIRVQALRALRENPHLKHLGLAAQLQARADAQAAGFDDVLLLTPDGHIAEGSFWNVVLWDGSAVTWPEAPILDGVTQRLLRAALHDAGVPQRHAPAPLDALADMRAAFALNSRGVQDIASIDGHVFEGDARFSGRLRELLAGCAWQWP